MENSRNPNQKIVSGVFWKFGEQLFSQGVSFLVSLILARLLSPEDYGAVAVVNIFIEIANVLLISGLHSALIQKREITREETSTVFYCGLGLSALLYGAMFFAAPVIAEMYALPVLVPVLRIFALRLPVAAIQSVQSAILSRELDFKKFFFSTIGATVVSGVVGIAMALLGYGPWALVAQSLVTTVVGTLILCFTVRWKPTRQFSLKAAKPLLRYGWKVMATDLLGTLFNNLSAMIIGARYTPAELAYYTKGKQLPLLLRGNLYNTVIGVLFPAMSAVNDDVAAVKAVADRSIGMLSYIVFPLMIGMAAVSENMVLVLLTEKWLGITAFVVIVCLESVISIVPTVSLQTLKATGCSGIMLKLEFIKKPIVLVSTLISMGYGVTAMAWMLPLNTLMDLVVNSVYTKKVLNYGLAEQLRACLPALVLSLVMGGAVCAVGLLELPPLSMLVLQVLTGVAAYTGLSALFRVEAFNIALGILKSRITQKRKK